MEDLIAGRITPAVANATCNAGSKLLKVVEMQYRYGSAAPDGRRLLAMATDEGKERE